jgi:hypothetical protein
MRERLAKESMRWSDSSDNREYTEFSRRVWTLAGARLTDRRFCVARVRSECRDRESAKTLRCVVPTREDPERSSCRPNGVWRDNGLKLNALGLTEYEVSRE